MSNEKVPVTILVPIKNEATNLPRCLTSVAWASEILVIDSQSSDDSVSIAESMGARVFQFHFSGIWPKKKNWTLDNVAISNEWVFILDADEVLPPEARDEIQSIVTSGESDQPVGYWIGRRFMFMGKWLKHCYYPNWNLRLFKHKLGRYEQLTTLDTASGDNEVHEHVVLNGKTSRLNSEMEHYAFPSVEVFVEKHNRYSNWEARVAMEKLIDKKMPGEQIAEVRFQRKMRKLAKNLPFRPLLRFLYVYVWQRGFLDGWEGYYFARLHGFYEFLVVAKTYEIKAARARPPQQ